MVAKKSSGKKYEAAERIPSSIGKSEGKAMHMRSLLLERMESEFEEREKEKVRLHLRNNSELSRESGYADSTRRHQNSSFQKMKQAMSSSMFKV